MKKALCLLAGVFLVSALFGVDGIRVTNPAAGSEWCLGSAYMIIWTPTGDWTNRVAIRLRRAGSADSEPAALVISADTGRIDPFRWTIPNTVPAGDYFIRVRTIGRTGTGEVLSGDSPNFKIKSCMLAAPPHTPELQINPAAFQQTLAIPVTFRTLERHRERHQWNCLMTMGIGSVPASPAEFKVGYWSRCADGGPGCADQCVSQVFRAYPLFDAVRLRTLIGKNIIKATLSFRHKSTEASAACAFGLKKVLFYSGALGDWEISASEARDIPAVGGGFDVRIDVTGMMGNWLREEDPAYRGEHHNYHMMFVGPNEAMEFDGSKCLSEFDRGSLEIKYRD